MSFLPNWDSFESTSRWSDILFWAGIICLILLAATEVASHIYGNRASILSKEAAKQQQEAEQAAEQRHTAEIGGLKSQLTEAEKKVTELQKVQPQRRLSQQEKDTLIAAMLPFPGQKISITCIMGTFMAKSLPRILSLSSAPLIGMTAAALASISRFTRKTRRKLSC